ncbi:hypothetical protein BV25DRAFT_1920231 [Artomyces pyxidatus]|uniref:Uncharacterized protein n=1 Tax=Artomyces pyxidatus TaxID=48021 RepID=A0ACB8SME6_9AGAM|nr:hypothetical protein BV25DRAFT_1920231 [Artomyces pyxidatus]
MARASSPQPSTWSWASSAQFCESICSVYFTQRLERSRLYWLGCYETEDLSSLGWLFDTDYASGAVRACTFGTSLARRAVIRGLGAAMRCILRVEDSTDIEPPQVFTARSSAHRPFAMRPKRIILHAPPPEHTAPPALSADTDRPPSPSPPPKRVHFADGSEERPRRARSFSHVKSESQRTRTLNGRVYDTRQLADEERGLGGGNRTVRPVRREDEDEDGGGMAWMRRRRELRERQRREQEEASASRVEEEGGTEQKEHVPVPDQRRNGVE